MICFGAGGALFAVSQVDLDAAGVERVIRRVNANEGRERLNIRVGQDGVGERLLPFAHGWKADVLRTVRDGEDHARILHREEALRHDGVQHKRQHKGAQRNQQGEGLVAQNPAHAHGVAVDDPVEEVFGNLVEAALLVFGGVSSAAWLPSWASASARRRRTQG